MTTSSQGLSAPSTYAPPRYHFFCDRVGDESIQVHVIAEAAGLSLQGWQDDVVSDLSAFGPDGKFVHRRVGLSIPRQVGKSHVLIAWVVYLACIKGYKVLWTDHNYSTTCEMLRRFKEIFGSKPKDPGKCVKAFNKRLVKVNNKTAQEAFFFRGGGSLHFATRTKTASLGFGFDVIVYDEAQELTDEHVQALAPTTSAGPKHNAQYLFAGTPKRAGSVASVFSDMRGEFVDSDQAPDDACWWEWGVSEKFDLSDKWLFGRNLAAINPSLGVTADEDSIRAGVKQLSEMAALQEYFGFWLVLGLENAVIDADLWDRCMTDSPPADGLLSYAIKFRPDGKVGTLAVCIRPQSGAPHVEVVESRSLADGFSWASDFMFDRWLKAACLVVDGKSEKDAFVGELSRRGVPNVVIMQPGTGDAIEAYSSFANAVKEGSITHYGQPALDKSAKRSSRRRIGSSGGWGFGGSEDVDESFVESCALAYWGAIKTKRNPNRKQRVGF